MAKIVVALGGNALSRDGKATAKDQLEVANQTAKELAKLVAAGHQLVIVHGNGPQIGNIILHEEAINTEKTPTMPIDVAGAMSQGQIGYWLQNAMRNQLESEGIKKPIAAIVTQVLVSKDDPAFKNPSKPIGPFYTEEEAKKLSKERHFTVKEDAGRGWRKVVPSPMPLSIIESELVEIALGNGAIIVAGGGGGIPVYYDEYGRLVGLEAVIDKDFAAEKLAETIDADILLILTAVENVKINFKMRKISRLSPPMKPLSISRRVNLPLVACYQRLKPVSASFQVAKIVPVLSPIQRMPLMPLMVRLVPKLLVNRHSIRKL